MGDIAADAQSSHRRGAILLLVAALLWSLNGLFIKGLFAGGEGLGGWSIAAYRSAVAGLALAPFAVRRWKPIAEKGWLIGALVMFTGMCATFVLATTLTSAANAIVLQYTAPAWVFLLSPLIVGDRTESRHWLAFGMSMAAVALIFAAQYTTDATGLLVGLASGVVFGCQGVLFRRVRHVDPVVMAFLSCAVSAVLLTPFALAIEGTRITGGQVGVLLIMGVVQFAIPYVLYSAGVGYVSAQTAVLLIMLEPVINPIWVYVGYGEMPHWSTLTGGAMILASVTYLTVVRTKGLASQKSIQCEESTTRA